MIELIKLTKVEVLTKFLEEYPLDQPNIKDESGNLWSFNQLFLESTPIKDSLYYSKTIKIAAILLNQVILKNNQHYPVRLGYLLYQSNDQIWDDYLAHFLVYYQEINLSLDSLIALVPYHQVYLQQEQATQRIAKRWDQLLTKLTSFDQLVLNCELLYISIYLYGRLEINRAQPSVPRTYYEYIFEVVNSNLGPIFTMAWEKFKDLELIQDLPAWYLVNQQWTYLLVWNKSRRITIQRSSVNNPLTRALFELQLSNRSN